MNPQDNDPNPIVAVVDIGSNSGRVVVYRVGDGGHLRILASTRAPLRLVRDLGQESRLSAATEERLLVALRDFSALAQAARAVRTIAVATSAIRDAANGAVLLAHLRKALGLEIRILSGEEEGRFGFLGAVSLPLGSLRLSDRFLRGDPPTGGEIRRLRDHVREALSAAKIAPLAPGEELVGTGGTLRNIAKIDRRRREYPIPRLHGYVLSRRRVKDVVDLVAERKLRKRGGIAGLNDDRGDSIVGGSVVIHTLMDALDAREVWVSGQGVREGLAQGLGAGSDHDLLPSPAAVREASLDALTRRFDGWDQARAERRSMLAAALLGALDPKAAPEVAEALGQAAGLLDVGRSVGFFDRHEHVADLVLSTDLDGFSHRGVALVSAIVRAAGDEGSSPKSYAPLLSAEDRDPVRRAAVVLAVADDIEERCRPDAPLAPNLTVTATRLQVKVPALLAWRARAIDRRFEQVFGRALVVTS